MPVPSIAETPAELAALERGNPLMIGRLRWLEGIIVIPPDSAASIG